MFSKIMIPHSEEVRPLLLEPTANTWAVPYVMLNVHLRSPAQEAVIGGKLPDLTELVGGPCSSRCYIFHNSLIFGSQFPKGLSQGGAIKSGIPAQVCPRLCSLLVSCPSRYITQDGLHSMPWGCHQRGGHFEADVLVEHQVEVKVVANLVEGGE